MIELLLWKPTSITQTNEFQVNLGILDTFIYPPINIGYTITNTGYTTNIRYVPTNATNKVTNF